MKTQHEVQANATRRYRDQLRRQARNGQRAVRVVRFGERFALAVLAGKWDRDFKLRFRFVVVSPIFKRRADAVAWSERKTLQTPPVRTLAVAA